MRFAATRSSISAGSAGPADAGGDACVTTTAAISVPSKPRLPMSCGMPQKHCIMTAFPQQLWQPYPTLPSPVTLGTFPTTSAGRSRVMSDSVRRALCEAVDGSILMGHMQELARWVKLSGTPDELQSLQYFQAKLDEYGYRTRLIMHDAYISLPGKARVDADNRAL